ncbi:MAG: mitochondrial fission ELM1 family protein [Gammaproteobacteria bacterium]|nr:mitochondrial fission ELM1 family protein [Gammaproteobacteria bacterium]
MNIWHLSDHKAGHVAQARGLFVALERCGITVNVLDISVSEVSSFALMMRFFSHGRIGQLPSILQGQSAPDLIVGVGHATHWPLILLKSCFPKAQSVVLMRPTLPISWFDFAIVPAHDYVDPEPKVSDHVFVSKGVLNPLTNQHRHEKNRHLILIGGASKRYAYSEEVLIQQIATLLDALSNKTTPQTVILTTSRRTPSSFLDHSFFKNKPNNLQVFPVTETPQGWLFEQLQLAETVWVTRDSGSMLFEALTAGCHVGLLTMPQIKEDTVTRATDLLSEQRFFLPLNAYLDREEFRAMPQLQEADRAVAWLLSKNLQG